MRLSLDISVKCYKVYAQVYENILKLSCWPVFTLCKAFLKNKRRSGTRRSSPHFLLDFWRKVFLTIYFNWLNFIAWLLLLIQIMDKMCITIIFCLVCHVISFEINFSFLIKLFFEITKSQDKNVNISRTKRAFNVKLKNIFLHF